MKDGLASAGAGSAHSNAMAATGRWRSMNREYDISLHYLNGESIFAFLFWRLALAQMLADERFARIASVGSSDVAREALARHIP